MWPANLSAEKATNVQKGYTPHSKESSLRALRKVLKVHTLCTASYPSSCGSLLFCEHPGQAVHVFQARVGGGRVPSVMPEGTLGTRATRSGSCCAVFRPVRESTWKARFTGLSPGGLEKGKGQTV